VARAPKTFQNMAGDVRVGDQVLVRFVKREWCTATVTSVVETERGVTVRVRGDDGTEFVVPQASIERVK
jgi:hypothetical protein